MIVLQVLPLLSQKIVFSQVKSSIENTSSTGSPNNGATFCLHS